MVAAREWTDAEEQALRDGNAAGRSLLAIARDLGIAKSIVSRKAAAMGLSWDRAATEQATKARVADAKARRAELQLRLLEDAERLRAQLWAPTVAFNFGGKDNTYNEHHLDEPTFADKLKLMQSVGIAVDRSLKLDTHDSGGSDAVRGLLGGLAEQLGLTHPDE